MASLSVSVLAPNGRRQTVKCTGNTTIMQIIEEVCKKQGFDPDDWDLKHHNKVLDTTISVRFSGLPNNAQLELTAATKARRDSDVILAVNLENGDRKQGTFRPDTILWNVLDSLCPEDLRSGDSPVVIYMRAEIHGQSLHETTLKKLGITGGRAMIRLVHKKPEELRSQANVSAPIVAKPQEEKPFRRTLKVEPETQQPRSDSDLLKLAREKRKLEEAQKVPASKPKIEFEKEEKMEVDDSPQVERKVAKQAPAVAKTAPVKLEVESKDDVQEDNFVFLGERNAMLFSLETSRTIPEDLPDEFFELTIDDAKRILSDIRRRRGDMDNGKLMTAEMRNLEESKRQLRQLNKYKKSVIRVQFPDRSILQGTFTPIETVEDVCRFVAQYLEDDSVDYYLYTTPPKSMLPKSERLIEAGCVPGALLHLGTDGDKELLRLKAELKDKFTTNSVASLAASKTRKQNTRAVANLEDPMENNGEEPMDSSSDPSVPGPSSRPTSYERKVTKSTEKVPKWFKTAK